MHHTIPATPENAESARKIMEEIEARWSRSPEPELEIDPDEVVPYPFPMTEEDKAWLEQSDRANEALRTGGPEAFYRAWGEPDDERDFEY